MDKSYIGCIKAAKGILRIMSQIPPEGFKTLTITVLIGGMFLSACSDKAPDVSDKQEGMELEQQYVGTDTSVVIPAEQVPKVNASLPLTEGATDPEPSAGPFKIDAAANRVYLPKTGWISVDEFWEIYMNQPDKLPADLDHAALDAIRPADHM
jgi:hypothetical protein